MKDCIKQSNTNQVKFVKKFENILQKILTKLVLIRLKF